MLARSLRFARPGARAFASAANGNRVVVVDGTRTPFHPSGTVFNDYIAQELGRMAIKGLLDKTAIPMSEPDYVIMGNVIQEGVSLVYCEESGR